MSKQVKKMIAPIIIVLFILLYYISIGSILAAIEFMPFYLKVLSIIIILSLMGVALFMLIERIKEIRSGEEDDISKY